LFIPNYVLHSPGALNDKMDYQPGVDQVGPAAIALRKLTAIALRENFLNGTYAVADQIAEGDKVVTRWVYRGNPKNEIASAGRASHLLTITTIEVDRIRNSRITESWSMTNMPSLKLELDHF